MVPGLGYCPSNGVGTNPTLNDKLILWDYIMPHPLVQTTSIMHICFIATECEVRKGELFGGLYSKYIYAII